MTAQAWLKVHSLTRWRDRLATQEHYLGPQGAEFKALNARRQQERLDSADAQLARMKQEAAP